MNYCTPSRSTVYIGSSEKKINKFEHYRTRIAHHVKEQVKEMQRRVTKLSSSGGGAFLDGVV